MSTLNSDVQPPKFVEGFMSWGMFWLVIAIIAALVFFSDGINALLVAWQLPEYSHGPLIPILSGLLFLRQLKEFPETPGTIKDRIPGVFVVLMAVVVAVFLLHLH